MVTPVVVLSSHQASGLTVTTLSDPLFHTCVCTFTSPLLCRVELMEASDPAPVLGGQGPCPVHPPSSVPVSSVPGSGVSGEACPPQCRLGSHSPVELNETRLGHWLLYLPRVL